jgi:hypothetical protein
LKTNKTSHFMTNEGTALLPAVVASWVGWMQRSGCSFLPGDANVSGMAAILPCQFHEKKIAFDNQQDLKFHDQGGINALPGERVKLGTHDLDMPPIRHFCKCWCWWNGSHSPCHHHGEMLMLKSSMKYNVQSKQHLVLWTSAPFSLWTLPSLPKPRGRGLLTNRPSHCGFGWVQKAITCLRKQIQWNQLAFWMIQHLKPTLKNTMISAIEFCSRSNQFTTVTFKLVKSKHQDRPFLVCWTSIPSPWNFNEATSFLDVQTDIEENHRLRRRIMLQVELN